MMESKRTWRFLMTFWSLSYVRNYHIRAFLKILSKSEHRKPIKNNPVLQVSSWSLGGHGGSWWCWIWYLKSEYVTNLILFFIDSKNMVLQAIFEWGDKIRWFWPKVNIVHCSRKSSLVMPLFSVSSPHICTVLSSFRDMAWRVSGW